MIFPEFPKIPRLSRDCIVTEKIDGTNASIYIEARDAMQYATIDDPNMPWLSKDEQGHVVAVGSRTRWILPGKTDNYGFAGWVQTHLSELVTLLGPGHHFGEWWGSGIQRGYGLQKGDKRFSLFNTSRWSAENLSPFVSVVPTLYCGPFDTGRIEDMLAHLRATGSKAAPGFMRPEGVVVFHIAGNLMFKKTLEKDEQPKGVSA